MRAVLSLLIALAPFILAACSSSDSSSPTDAGGLLLEVDNTSTQIEPAGFRIQLRLTVVTGRAQLEETLERGAVTVRVCRGGDCEQGPVVADFAEASCPTIAGSHDVGVAWSQAEAVGVDVCLAQLEEGPLFETTILSGARVSNTITTRCTPGAFGLICGSG